MGGWLEGWLETQPGRAGVIRTVRVGLVALS